MEILQWLAKLLPKQNAKGDGNFQAGRVDGDLNNKADSNPKCNTRGFNE